MQVQSCVKQAPFLTHTLGSRGLLQLPCDKSSVAHETRTLIAAVAARAALLLMMLLANEPNALQSEFRCHFESLAPRRWLHHSLVINDCSFARGSRHHLYSELLSRSSCLRPPAPVFPLPKGSDQTRMLPGWISS